MADTVGETVGAVAVGVTGVFVEIGVVFTTFVIVGFGTPQIFLPSGSTSCVFTFAIRLFH
jgi:hypothetical protein